MAVDATLRLEALRREIHQLQSDIATGRTTLSEVLSRDDDAAQFVYVVKVLESVPGIGKVAARAHLARLGVAEHAHCGELEPDVRTALIEISRSAS